MMDEYYQEDRSQWENYFNLHEEENEHCEELIIELRNVLNKYSLKIQWAAVYAIQEEIDQMDKDEIANEQKINGYQYLP